MTSKVETMFYSGDVPWHGLGTYVGDEPVTSKEAIIAAGLDWEVETKPLYVMEGSSFPIMVETNMAIVRPKDNHILGVVGNRYCPIQNVEAFEFMDSLIEDGSMRYHTAGSLRDGKRIWLLGKTDSFEAVKGDQVDNYLFLWNSHDGTTALRCLFTSVRVVCANTARAALSGRDKDGVRLIHTKNSMLAVSRAKEVLGLSQIYFKKFKDFSLTVADIQMNTLKLNSFVQDLFPSSDSLKDVPRSIKKAREQVTRLFEEGRGNDMPGAKGTAWAAFNAVTEYSNYYQAARGQNKQERRFESTMFGPSVELIQRAQNLLLAA